MFKNLKSIIWYLEEPTIFKFSKNSKEEVSVHELFFDLAYALFFGFYTGKFIIVNNFENILFSLSIFYLLYKYWTEITYYFIIYPNRNLRGRIRFVLSIVPLIFFMGYFQNYDMPSQLLIGIFLMGLINFYFWFSSVRYYQKHVKYIEFEVLEPLKRWQRVTRENYLYLIVFICVSPLIYYLEIRLFVIVYVIVTLFVRYLFDYVISKKDMQYLVVHTKSIRMNFDILKERFNLLIIIAFGECIKSVIDIMALYNNANSVIVVFLSIVILMWSYFTYVHFYDFFVIRSVRSGVSLQLYTGLVILFTLVSNFMIKVEVVRYINKQPIDYVLLSILFFGLLAFKGLEILNNVQMHRNSSFTGLTYSDVNDNLGRMAINSDIGAHGEMFIPSWYKRHNFFHLLHNVYSFVLLFILFILDLIFKINFAVVLSLVLVIKFYDIATIVYYFYISSYKNLLDKHIVKYKKFGL